MFATAHCIVQSVAVLNQRGNKPTKFVPHFLSLLFLGNFFWPTFNVQEIVILDDEIAVIDYFIFLSFNFWLHWFHPLSPNLSRKYTYPH